MPDTPGSPKTQTVWLKHAGQWARIASPLRPAPDDSEIMWQLLRTAAKDSHGPRRVIVLGVTPELVNLPWPDGSTLVAVDKSPEMIATVWKPNARIASRVERARWQAMPIADGWADVMVGDGSFNALPSLADWRDMLAELARVMSPDGVLAARFYVRPDAREPVEAVVRDVWAGRIKSLHALKWRLAMSLDGGPACSVAVADIRRIFEDHFPNRAALERATGWPQDIIATIDAYHNVPTRYTFPTMADITTTCGGSFARVERRAATYELAERCPTLLFRRVRS